MKKSSSKPIDETPEQELKRLRKENAKLRKEKEAEKAGKEEVKVKLKKFKSELSKERKKKDAPRVKLTEEQWRQLSNLFPDIDSLFK